MEEKYDLSIPGKNYIDEIKNKCSWEVRIWHKHNRFDIIDRGAPLECTVLVIDGKNFWVPPSLLKHQTGFGSVYNSYALPKNDIWGVNDIWSIVVRHNKITIINLEGSKGFEITGKDISTKDWWGWGDG